MITIFHVCGVGIYLQYTQDQGNRIQRVFSFIVYFVVHAFCLT